MVVTDTTQSANRGRLRRLFVGSAGFRAGWRFLIFAAIVFALQRGKRLVVAEALHGVDQETL